MSEKNKIINIRKVNYIFYYSSLNRLNTISTSYIYIYIAQLLQRRNLKIVILELFTKK